MPTTTRSARREITSAIPQLTVPEVRRGLDLVRRAWGERAEVPFELSAPSVGDLTVQDFCFQFLLGQHRKRHARRRG